MSQWTQNLSKDAGYPDLFNHMPTMMCLAEYGDTLRSLHSIVDGDVDCTVTVKSLVRVSSMAI